MHETNPPEPQKPQHFFAGRIRVDVHHRPYRVGARGNFADEVRPRRLEAHGSDARPDAPPNERGPLMAQRRD
jgi:hypothetical protein